MGSSVSMLVTGDRMPAPASVARPGWPASMTATLAPRHASS